MRIRPRSCSLLHRDTRRTFCGNVQIAGNFLTRFVGLLAHRNLQTDHALWLRPSNGIHTFFMRFPIDIVALDRNGTVVRTAENIRPWRIVGAPLQTRSIVELPAGHLRAHPIAVGDRITPNYARSHAQGLRRRVAAKPLHA